METTRPPKQHDLATQIFWSEFRCVFTQPQITLELSPTPARNAAMSSGHARQQRIHPKQHVRHLKHRNWWRMYCWGDLKHWSTWACENILYIYINVLGWSPPNTLNKIWSRMSRMSRKMVDKNHLLELGCRQHSGIPVGYSPVNSFTILSQVWNISRMNPTNGT